MKTISKVGKYFPGDLPQAFYMGLPRCNMVCPHGDRCIFYINHDNSPAGTLFAMYGCSYRVCFCNDASFPLDE